MLSRDQLVHLFNRFAFLVSQPDVKKRIADAVNDKRVKRKSVDTAKRYLFANWFSEAVAVTTAIQEEIFSEMGVDPQFGLACLGKLNVYFENDQDLMIQFYGFVTKEEIACEEAELGPERFAEMMEMQHSLQQKQLEMLQHIRNFHFDDQSAVLEKIHQQLDEANFEPQASLLSVEQIQDIVKRRVSPVFQPR